MTPQQEAQLLSTLTTINNTLKSAVGRSSLLNNPVSRNGAVGTNTAANRASAASANTLSGSLNNLNRTVISLNRAMSGTVSGLANLNRALGTSSNARGARNTGGGNMGGGGGGGGNGRDATGAERLAAALGGGVRTAVALGSAFTALGTVVTAVTDDFFRLSSAGINVSTNLVGLYKSAIMAGMSLQEYTQILQESGPAVARASSLEEFNQSIQGSVKTLGSMGIFGAEATKLAANLKTTSAVLGVPQAQAEAAAKMQLATFEQLRKSSFMTAEQFSQMTDTLRGNEEVQNNLLGLSKEQRAARFNEITQIYTVGNRLGMTAEASRKLGEALLAQRKASVQDRFTAAGRIQQAAALTGMNSGEADELARLSRKKNLTAEESQRQTMLAGRLQEGLATMENSDSFNQQYIAEQIRAALPAQTQALLQSAGEARLTGESGAVKNVDMGAKLSENTQKLGEILTVLKGIGSSVIGIALAVAAGGIAGSILKKMSGLGNLAGGARSMLGGGGSAIGGLGNGLKSVLGSAGSVLKLSGFATFFFGAISEAITGDFAAAFTGGDTGGLGTKIASMLGAGILEIFTFIPKFIDTLIGTNVTNFVERTFVMLAATITKAGSFILDKLGFDGMAKSLSEKAEKADDLLLKLNADHTKTISSIGKATKDEVAKQKAALAQTVADSNRIVMGGGAGLASNVRSTASSLAAQAAAIASPGSTMRSGVTQPEVNTPNVAGVQNLTQNVAGAGVTQSVPSETVLTQILSILQQSLTAENQQVVLAEQLVRSTGRSRFTDNTTLVEASNRLS